MYGGSRILCSRYERVALYQPLICSSALFMTCIYIYIYICEYVANTLLHRMHMRIYIIVIALCRDDAPLAFVAHRAHFPWGWLHRSEMRGCWCGLMWRWQRGWRCLMLFVYVYCGVVGGYFYLHPISVLGYCCFKAVYCLSYIVYNDQYYVQWEIRNKNRLVLAHCKI